MSLDFEEIESYVINRLCSHNRNIYDNKMLVVGVYEDRDCIIKQCFCAYCRQYHLIGSLKL